jgi:hypothetical protein|tara:strand:- start:1304 stop:1567 length:264 start_codon:yes stop_codon:yes gene_type:complete
MKEITRSYSRKIQLENYGGNKYESADFFASWKEEIPDGTSSKDEKKISDELFRCAKQDVNDSIHKSIKEMNSAPPFQGDELAGGRKK